MSLMDKLRGFTAGWGQFNDWLDDTSIELSSVMLKLGFILGTIDIFSSLSLSTSPWFNTPWSIFQALAIDGLFFSVYGRIRRSWGTWWVLVYILVGLFLSLVAALVNSILGYQSLNHIPLVSDAMNQLGINQVLFTYARSILVVVVAAIVALFPRGTSRLDQHVQQAAHHGRDQEVKSLWSNITELRSMVQSVESSQQRIESKIESMVLGLQSGAVYTITEESNEMRTVSIEQRSKSNESNDGSNESWSNEGSNRSKSNGSNEGSNRSKSNGSNDGYYELIRTAMLDLQAKGEKYTYPVIAETVGCSLQTVKFHGPKIKKEIGERTTDRIPAVV